MYEKFKDDYRFAYEAKIKLNQIITSNLLKNYNNDITIHQLNITLTPPGSLLPYYAKEAPRKTWE